MTVTGVGGSQTRAYGYDHMGRLTGSGTYTYDGKGSRIVKVSASTTTVYAYSGAKVIAEYVNGAAPSSPTREYVYSGGTLLAKIESGATLYYHHDHLSVRVMTDSSGNMLGQQGHFPFGESWYLTNTTTKWEFTSYERDSESGNDYALARYHANRIGRFNSPDPLSGSTGDPQSLNKYAYVRNDPIDYVDPLGLVLNFIGDDGGGSDGSDSGDDSNGGDDTTNTCTAASGCATATGCPAGGGTCTNQTVQIVYPDQNNQPSAATDSGDQPGSYGVQPGGGGGGGGVRGFLRKLAKRLNCAAQFGDAHSLAAASGTQNSFLGKAFLGNTISGLTQLGLFAVGSPSDLTPKDVGVAVLSGTHQGLPGGGNVGKGPLGVAQDAIVGPVAAGAYNILVGAGSQTLELGISSSTVAATVGAVTAETAAGVVAAVKLVGDGAVFATGYVKCK